MSDPTKADQPVEPPSLKLWLGAIVVTLFGLFAGALGALGALFELEPAPIYDVAAPPEHSSYEAMRAIHAVCRLDEMEKVKGDGSCVLPLAADEAPFDGYASAPLMLKIDCMELIDLVGEEAYGARRPTSCEPFGKCYGLDVHDETFQRSMKARYPGFAGEVMEPPTAKDIEEKKETRIIFLGFLGIGAAGGIGGIMVLRILWRRRKRAAG